nr:dihydrodipicolinate synthase family protein [Polynucleobacter sp. HIN7]
MVMPVHPSSFSSVLSPVLTPFNADGGPNSKKLLRQCQWLQSHGVGQAVFGTNSEANSMSARQKIMVLEELIDGGLNPNNVMPGTGACSVDDAVAMTRAAVNAGCAGVLMLPPFYYKDVADDGLFAFYAEVIEKVADANLKIYVYNIPPVTKIGLSIPLLERLVKAYPNTVIGMKDSSGDWPYTESVIKALGGSGFRVYAGSEVFLLRTLKAGGVGCISATANVNPKAIAQLAARWQESGADALQESLSAVRAIFAQFPMIPGMKAAVAHYSGDPDWLRVRPPLLSLDAEQQNRLVHELQKINFQMEGL